MSLTQARVAARAIAEQARKVSQNASKGGWEVDPWTQEQLKAESTLNDAISRLEEKGTWKRWSCHICPLGGAYYYDAEAYREHMMTHLSAERRRLMPLPDSKVRALHHSNQASSNQPPPLSHHMTSLSH